MVILVAAFTLDYAQNDMQRFSVICLILCLSALSAADVYRWVDEEGNVVYSDRPIPGAEQLKSISVQTISLPPVPAPAAQAAPPLAQPKRYLSFAIIQPSDDQAIRDNAGNISVSVLVEPSLYNELGHKLQLYLDGAPWGEAGGTVEYTLPNLDRGTHQLKAQVLDGDGAVVATTDAVTFHLLRQSILQ